MLCRQRDELGHLKFRVEELFDPVSVITKKKRNADGEIEETYIVRGEDGKLYEIGRNDECIYQIYGSTLLASVYFEKYNFWFSIQIGDGKTIAFKSDNSVFYPIPEDDDMGFGVTASLCSNNAMRKFITISVLKV